MTEYEKGTRLRVIVEGVYQGLNPYSSGLHSLSNELGGVPHMINLDYAQVQSLEPAYEVGQAYIDADNRVFIRGDDSALPWVDEAGDWESDHYPSRPLRKLVPEG
jgi:hypothetical protein